VRWDDVMHQDAALRRLEGAIAGGRLSHAYIFAGPEGVGKHMAARRLAQRILCSAGTKRSDEGSNPQSAILNPQSSDSALSTQHSALACGRCDDCLAVAAGTHLDLHDIDRTMNRFHPDATVRNRKAVDLGVDVIRHFVIEPAGVHPSRGRAKIFIIQEAESMSPGAQNALLKTLEEPPGASYLMLLASSVEALLPTTRSRCQVVSFARLPDDFVRERLAAATTLAEGEIDYLTGLADGRLGVALKFAASGLHARRGDVLELIGTAQHDPLAFGKAALDSVKSISRGETGAGDDDAAETESAETLSMRSAQSLLLRMLTCGLRDILRVSTGLPPKAHTLEAERVSQLAARFGRHGASRAIRAAASAESELEMNVNAGLVFDALGIAMSRG